MEAGCYIKLDTMVTFKRPLELRVWDWGSDGSNNSSPRLVHTDQRQSMNIQFITPHFTPWDEIFELVPRGQEEESTATFMGMKREIPEEAGMNNSTSGGGGGGGGGARRWRLRFDWRISDVDYLVTPDLRD